MKRVPKPVFIVDMEAIRHIHLDVPVIYWIDRHELNKVGKKRPKKKQKRKKGK